LSGEIAGQSPVASRDAFAQTRAAKHAEGNRLFRVAFVLRTESSLVDVQLEQDIEWDEQRALRTDVVYLKGGAKVGPHVEDFIYQGEIGHSLADGLLLRFLNLARPRPDLAVC
jgi:hypothetical protein